MKRLFAKTIVLILFFLSAVGLAGCDPASMGNLPEFARPYAGTYECQFLQFDGQNLLDDFTYLRLELKEDETFRVYYLLRTGERGDFCGTYAHDAENACFRFSAAGSVRKAELCVPVQNGKLDFSVQYGQKILIVRFER